MRLPFHIIKRPYMKTYMQILVRVIGIFVAFLITSLIKKSSLIKRLDFMKRMEF